MTWSEDLPQGTPAPGDPVPETDGASPATGDEQVDAALERLDGAADEPLSTQIEAAEHVHEVLQGRLSDLGDG